MTAVKIRSAAIRFGIEDIEWSIVGSESGRGLQRIIGAGERVVCLEQHAMRQTMADLRHENVVFGFHLAGDLRNRIGKTGGRQRSRKGEELNVQRFAVERTTHEKYTLALVRDREIAVIESRQAASDTAQIRDRRRQIPDQF